MNRSSVEAIREAFDEKREAFFCQITNRTIDAVIALCNYALELEQQLEAEQKSVNELSLYVQDLEDRVRKSRG